MSDYPWNLDVRPLTTWPAGELTPHWKRRRSQFATPMSRTLSLLTRELAFLNAQRPVMEVAIPPEQFRIDGKPRAQAIAAHPGVVLSLPTTSEGPLRYATDVFMSWQDNLRGIALGLEALRKVERYGITRRGEQYVGFKALPPGGISLSAPMTLDEAARTLVKFSGRNGDDSEDVERVIGIPSHRKTLYRLAALLHHPDKGGDPSVWAEITNANDLLEAHQ